METLARVVWVDYKEGVGKEITNQDNSFEERNGKKNEADVRNGVKRSLYVCLFLFV